VRCSTGDNKGILFALKVFRRLSSTKRRERFLNESQFLKTCSHPAIMCVFDDGVYRAQNGDQYPFVIAEYLPSTLADVIRRKDVPMVQKVSLALDLVSALGYLDNLNQKVVHRDIKPQNIFVKGRSCVLGDFGLRRYWGKMTKGTERV